MPGEPPVPVAFDGLDFPVWVVVDGGAEREIGESFATHYLTADDGDKELPLFTTEALARAYIAARPLPGYEPAPVHDPADLLIRLELFRSRGGTHVRIDDPRGPSDGHPAYDLAGFIDLVREAG